MSKFDRVVLVTILIVFLFVPALFIMERFNPVTVVCESSDDCSTISINGSLLFRFSRAVDSDLVESLFSTHTTKANIFEWLDDQTLRWFAADPPDSMYEILIELSRGKVGISGRYLLKNYSWEVVIREPDVVGMVLTGKYFDLYKIIPQESGDSTPLTQSNGTVLDYAPSPDGEWVLFALENDSGGIDLWKTNRDGENTGIFADCGQDKCIEPSWALFSGRIAFTRESNSSGSLTSEIYLADSIFEKPMVLGFLQSEMFSSPVFSPNGKWLSVRQNGSDSRILVKLDSRELFPIKDSIGNNGCWLSGSDTYFLIGMENAAGIFRNRIFRVDLANRDLSVVGEGQSEALVWGVDQIACNPVNGSLAVIIQPNIRVPSYELVVVDFSNNETITVMKDYSLIIGSPTWSPDGDCLVFSGQKLGDDLAEVKTFIWNRESETLNVISAGLTAPSWLP